MSAPILCPNCGTNLAGGKPCRPGCPLPLPPREQYRDLYVNIILIIERRQPAGTPGYAMVIEGLTILGPRSRPAPCFHVYNLSMN